MYSSGYSPDQGKRRGPSLTDRILAAGKSDNPQAHLFTLRGQLDVYEDPKCESARNTQSAIKILEEQLKPRPYLGD